MTERDYATPCPLKCVHCGHEFSTYIVRVKTTPDIACPACDVVTHYDAQALRQTLDRVDRALVRLRNTLRQA